MSERFVLDMASARGFCERFGLTYLVNEELGQIAVPRPDREGWVLRLVPLPEREMFTIAYPLPGEVPPERFVALALAANLLNAHTFMGAWVMNIEAAELYFRHTVVTAGVMFSDESMRDMISMVVGTVEEAAPALDAVLKGAAPEAVMLGKKA